MSDPTTPLAPELDALSRGEFLRLAAGFGAAAATGLGALAAARPAAADESPAPAPATGSYLFVVTHGTNDMNRAVLPLVLATTVLKKGWGKVHVWLTLAGAEIAHKELCPKILSPAFKAFGTAEALILALKEKGATFGICSPCAVFSGAMDAKRYDFIPNAGGDALLPAMAAAGTHTVWI